jgi:putative transposase
VLEWEEGVPYWRLFYHFTWGTKLREPLIGPAFEADLHRVIAAKALELQAVVHAVGGIEDHIHLVASVSPKFALSTFIGQVKGNSSHFVNHVVQPDYTFAWQEEYGVVSFDEKNLGWVVRYTLQQREHHKAGTTVARLEQVSD